MTDNERKRQIIIILSYIFSNVGGLIYHKRRVPQTRILDL